MFNDDTSIILSNSDSIDHATEFIVTFDQINALFAINSLLLNLTKTNYVDFTAKSNTKIDININFEDIQIKNIYNTKFLGLTTENTLSQKKQIE